MVKHNQTVILCIGFRIQLKKYYFKKRIHFLCPFRLLPTNCLSLFDHFVGLVLKGIISTPNSCSKLFNSLKYDNLSLQTTWGQPVSTGQLEYQLTGNTFWVNTVPPYLKQFCHPPLLPPLKPILETSISS